LLHGFPYDPRAFDAVVPIVNAAGFRALVPFLRGYGGTRLIAPDAMRSGQQAAIGHDLLDLLDALGIAQATLAGFDWGARAACVVAALWPERVRGLVTNCGYQIQDIATSLKPADPESEHRYWYQYYFHTERGRAGLEANRGQLCRLLWKLWSPTWAFDDATYDHSAASFDNPDFVDVVIHSYRHRFGNAEGDPRYAATEARLARLPRIDVPTIALHGSTDGVIAPRTSEKHRKFFGGAYERRLLDNIGHNAPQEAPAAFAQAVLDLCRR
ncbi:MAG: alpha/beta hydrolase, partial [Proteobacteria bacterium]|nr:alpha/beta hydrolase [Pseudomonadota bacterium]